MTPVVVMLFMVVVLLAAIGRELTRIRKSLQPIERLAGIELERAAAERLSCGMNTAIDELTARRNEQ